MALNSLPLSAFHPRRDQTIDAANRTAALIQDVDAFLGRLKSVQRRRNLALDEVLILLTLGRLGLSPSTFGVTIRPVKCSDVALKLNIPKETVRRKILRLVDCGLVSMSRRGAALENLDEWAAIAAAVAD